MKHQIRMEMTLAAEAGRVNVAKMVAEVVSRANSGLMQVRFFDVNDVPFTGATVPSGREFITRLAVEKVERGKTRKMVMGFFMQSRLHLNDIKSAIGVDWLQQNRIFLRPQRMSFTFGTDLFLIGYLTREHPLTANMENLESKIAEKWLPTPVHTIDKMTDDDDVPPSAEFTSALQLLTERDLIKDHRLQFPATVERSILKVHAAGKPSFDTQILSVYVPRKYHEAATLLNDFSINERDDLSIIPFSLSKNAPDQFYQQMSLHAEFMHDHRNIPIFSVPSSPYYSNTIAFPPQHEGPQVSLAQILSSNPSIYRIYPRLEDDKIQLSVIGVDDYYKVCKWLDELLLSFSYAPYRLRSTRANSSTNQQPPQHTSPSSKTPFTNKYKDRFAVTATSQPSTFDPSTTPHPRAPRRNHNAWNIGPPIEVVYDPDEPNNFPPLAPADNNTNAQTFPQQHDVARPVLVNGGYGPQPVDLAHIPPPPPRIGGGRGHGRHAAQYSRQFIKAPQNKNPDLDNNQPNFEAPENLEEIIAKAVAASTRKLAADLQDTQDRFLAIDAKFSELQQMITDNARSIAAATSEATITALTGPTSPFITRADNLQRHDQQLQTETKITNMQISLDQLIAAVTALTHPRVPPTPPRVHKLSKRDHPDTSPAPPADPFPNTFEEMEEDEGVGED